MTFSSVYEMFDPLTTVRKQRFWEWFSGDDLRAWWNTTTIGSSTVTTNDAVDGGIIITTGAASGDRIELGFANKRQYNYNANVCIAVAKTNSLTSCAMRTGFLDDTLVLSADAANSSFDTALDSTYYILTTGYSGGSTTTASTFTADTNFHVFKTECGASNVKSYIDGVLQVTNSTNLPADKMQPHISGQTRTTSARTFNFRYIEAYNT